MLSEREVEMLRRVQLGAFPHPEFEAHPEYVTWSTCVKEVMIIVAVAVVVVVVAVVVAVVIVVVDFLLLLICC